MSEELSSHIEGEYTLVHKMKTVCVSFNLEDLMEQTLQ